MWWRRRLSRCDQGYWYYIKLIWGCDRVSVICSWWSSQLSDLCVFPGAGQSSIICGVSLNALLSVAITFASPVPYDNNSVRPALFSNIGFSARQVISPALRLWLRVQSPRLLGCSGRILKQLPKKKKRIKKMHGKCAHNHLMNGFF